uniref:Uncharacterized protein n=1 Tax=Leersia perrieri TaxID=77586 RepID=A0A0D9WQ31_9ORYZ
MAAQGKAIAEREAAVEGREAAVLQAQEEVSLSFRALEECEQQLVAASRCQQEELERRERDIATREQEVGDVEARAQELEQRERALPPQPVPHFGEAAPDLERARQRIADLEHMLDLGTKIMAASVARLHEAAREVGCLGGLASQVDVLAKGIKGVLEEVDEVAKDSPYDLAR